MKQRGRGIACMWYPIGFTVAANPSAATVKVNEDGTATVLTGGTFGETVDNAISGSHRASRGAFLALLARSARSAPRARAAARSADHERPRRFRSRRSEG